MKIRFFCVLILCSVLLPGCKGKPEMPAVGICYRDRAEDPLAAVLEEKLTACGWQVRWADAKNDQWKQDNQIGELLAEGCDLMIVEPVMRTTAQSTVEQLRKSGVPGIFLRNKPEDAVLSSWEEVCFVGCDKAQPGILQGQILLKTSNAGDINGDGVVSYVLLQGPEDDVDAYVRSQGCIRAMGAQSRCLSRCCCGWSVADARAACARELMQKGSAVEAVFCGSELLAQGALEAAKNAGRNPGKDIYLVGLGTSNGTLALIRKGILAGTVAEDLAGQAAQTAQAAQLLLNGALTEKEYYVNHKVITAPELVQTNQAAFREAACYLL